MNIDENVEKLEPSYIAGGNCWKIGSSSKIKCRVTLRPAHQLLCVCTSEVKTYVHTKNTHECS